MHSELASQGQTAAPHAKADLDFHFISLVEVQGHLYELDGNNDGPLDCGALALPLITLTPTPTLTLTLP